MFSTLRPGPATELRRALDGQPVRRLAEATRKGAYLAAALAALALTACATAGTALTAAGTLSAAGYSISAYCALTPAARSEIRRKLGLNVQLFCATDRATLP